MSVIQILVVYMCRYRHAAKMPSMHFCKERKAKKTMKAEDIEKSDCERPTQKVRFEVTHQAVLNGRLFCHGILSYRLIRGSGETAEK